MSHACVCKHLFPFILRCTLFIGCGPSVQKASIKSVSNGVSRRQNGFPEEMWCVSVGLCRYCPNVSNIGPVHCVVCTKTAPFCYFGVFFPLLFCVFVVVDYSCSLSLSLPLCHRLGRIYTMPFEQKKQRTLHFGYQASAPPPHTPDANKNTLTHKRFILVRCS